MRGGVVSAPSAARHVSGQAVPPRVDAMGVQPGNRTGVVAIPTTAQPSPRRGFDWAWAAIAVAAVLSIALLGLACRSALTAPRAPSRRA
jgi:hypothetical protein